MGLCIYLNTRYYLSACQSIYICNIVAVDDYIYIRWARRLGKMTPQSMRERENESSYKYSQSCTDQVCCPPFWPRAFRPYTGVRSIESTPRTAAGIQPELFSPPQGSDRKLLSLIPFSAISMLYTVAPFIPQHTPIIERHDSLVCLHAALQIVSMKLHR